MPVATLTRPGHVKLAKRWRAPDSITNSPASASKSPPAQSRLRARRTLPSMLASAVVARHEQANEDSTSGARFTANSAVRSTFAASARALSWSKCALGIVAAMAATISFW